MRIVNQVVILSGESISNTFEGDRQATTTLEGVLADLGLPYKSVQGFFNNSLNNSFVVVIKNEEELEALKAIAFGSFKQDAILHQDSNQRATLHLSNGTRKALGTLKQVASTDGLDSYTIMGGNIYAAI